MKFYITQKYELEILKNIVKLIHQDSNQNNDASFDSVRSISNFKLDFYRLEISTHAYLLRTIAYFEKYQLQGKKHIVFNRWKRIYLNKDILKKQASSSEKALTRFKRLVNSVQNSDN